MKYLALSLLVLLSSCSTLEVSGSIDRSNKSILVPPGSAVSEIKKGLVADGWAVQTSGALAVTGAMVTNTKTESASARYAMIASMDHFDYSLDFKKMYHYDISILDMKNSQEVLTMSGDGTSRSIAKKLIAALK